MSGEHPTRAEDFDLYALGALDDAERQAFESHVASCADCAEKLAAARGRVAILAFAAPSVAPSPGVKESLMRQVIASAEGTGGSFAHAKSAHAADGGVFARWWAALLPVAGAFALATVLLWLHNEQLDRQLADLHNTIAQQKQELAETRHQADLIAARETLVIPLSAQKGAPEDHPEGHARVLYNAKEGMMTYDGWLPAAPADKSYQLWLLPPKGGPLNAGGFNPPNGEKRHT